MLPASAHHLSGLRINYRLRGVKRDEKRWFDSHMVDGARYSQRILKTD